jgi:tetratricopeptide (TPR) repeat protein
LTAFLIWYKASFYSVLEYFYFYHKDDLSTSMAFLEKALSLSRSIGDVHQQASALNCLADIKWNIGDLATAQTNAAEAQRLARLSGNLFDKAQAIQIAATCYCVHGDYKSGISLLQTARNLVNLYGIAGGSLDRNIMRDLAQVHMFKTEYTEARSIHADLIQKMYPDQHSYAYSTSFICVAEADLKTGVTRQDVRQAAEKAKGIYDAINHRIGSVCCDMILADLDLRDGDTQAAKVGFHQCLKASWGKFNEVVSYSLERLADGSLWSTADWTSTCTWLMHKIHRKSSPSTRPFALWETCFSLMGMTTPPKASSLWH